MSTAPTQPEFRLEHTPQDIQDFNDYLFKLFQQEGNLTLPLWLFAKELHHNCKKLEDEVSWFEENGFEVSNIRSQLQLINQSLESRDVAASVLFGVPGVMHANRHIVGDDMVRRQLCGPKLEEPRRSFYHGLCAIKLLLLEAMADFSNFRREEIAPDSQNFRYGNTEKMNLDTTLHAKMPSSVTPSALSGWGGRSRDGGREQFSVFISHAGEDKNTLAVPLRRALTRLNVSSFLDVAELRPGDDASASMLNAMDTAWIAVVLLSAEFSGKKWPMLELERFLRRRRGFGNPVFVLPVFYRISRRDCKEFGRFIETNGEVFQKVWFFDRVDKGETSVEYVTEVMAQVAEIEGIECDGEAGREVNGLVERIVKSTYEGMFELLEVMKIKLRDGEAKAKRLESSLTETQEGKG